VTAVRPHNGGGTIRFDLEHNGRTPTAKVQLIEAGTGRELVWTYEGQVRLVVTRDGQPFASYDHETVLDTPPGDYQLTYLWADGHRRFAGAFTVAHAACLNNADERWTIRPGISAAIQDDMVQTLSITRIAPDYGNLHTKVEWWQGGRQIAETIEQENEHTPPNKDWEYSDWLVGNPDACASVFRAVRVNPPIPPEVLALGGTFAVRLVSPSTRTYELDVQVPRGELISVMRESYRPPEIRAVAMREVEARPDELRWMEQTERTYVRSFMTSDLDNAKAISFTPDVFRALHRNRALAPLLGEFVRVRQAGSATTVDRADAYHRGVERGESISAIDRSITKRQRALDQDDAALDREKTARAKSLRAKIVPLIAKYGTPFRRDELPGFHH
jgi:hypothetical protein